ncbi:MAG: alpha amylase C-terminal domain-containing protein, partial [Faecalibacillus sp.]
IYWQGNIERGVNVNAIEFLKYMNQGLKQRHPYCLLIAEDSTSYPDVTKPVHEGGLGFDYKWDMGWMNDTLDYFKLDMESRKEHYHQLTFSMMYYYNDRYLLPLSHDEVVHGKGTIIQKMHGNYEEKFSQARAFYMYMYSHPGKKLNFMGNEIAQFREWNEKREQDWDLLSYPIHDAFFRFMRDLNRFYLYHSALFELDDDREGFQWLDCHQEEKCIYAFERTSHQERIVAVFHFLNQQDEYTLKVDHACELHEVFSSQQDIYGGIEKDFGKIIKGDKGIFQISLMPYGAVYYLVK